MLNRAIEYENAFSHYADDDIGFQQFLDHISVEDGMVAGVSLVTDWEKVKRVSRFLEIFYDLTVKVSGSRYVTSNFHFLEICEVAVYLKQLVLSEDISLSSMAVKMKAKFDKYWGDPKRMNKMIFIACVLDPRYKFDSVSFALEQMFGVEPGKVIEGEVRKYMASLFNQYLNPPSKDSHLSVISISSSSSVERTSGSSSTQVRKGLGSFKQDLKKHKSNNGGVDNRTELDKYLDEKCEDENEAFNVLDWWKLNSLRLPVLAKMARDVLAIPVSSVASECAFSTGGRILDAFRSSLTPKLVQALVCLQDWIRSESLPVSVEEDLDFLEQLEQDFANLGKEPCIVDA